MNETKMYECDGRMLTYLVEDVGEKNKGKNIQKFSVKMWGNRLPSFPLDERSETGRITTCRI
jgi:hypothetical protein